MAKRLLILGVDPGANLGYAFLDLEGNVVDVDSSKILRPDDIILRATELGRVVVVGADVNLAPAFARKLAVALGASLAFPEENIWTKHKGEMVRGYGLKDNHQKDAMVAALVAYNQIKPVLEKIKRILKRKGKIDIQKEVAKLVLTKNHMSVDKAVRKLNMD